MILEYKSEDLVFQEIELTFDKNIYENVFSKKNNKTLLETISFGKYKKFETEVLEKYKRYLDYPIGSFLLELKIGKDNFYLNFLNKYGDKTYCNFKIKASRHYSKKGLYLYSNGQQLKYIGRCLDSFYKRVNCGYGKIHPKNCYIDGQATNCRLNSLIAQYKEKIMFYILSLESGD